jgi:hypothetical protein
MMEYVVSADATVSLEPISRMVIGTINRPDSIGTPRILSTFITDQIIPHGLIIENLIGRMGIRQFVRRQVRHNVLIVYHPIDIGDHQVDVCC